MAPPSTSLPRLRATRLSLLRLGLVSRLLVLLLAVGTQVTRLGVQTQSNASGASSVVTFASHYDGSGQLFLAESLARWSSGPSEAAAGCSSLGPLQRAWTESLSWLAHWDGVHFLEVAERAGYGTEMETAFAPGWPTLVHVGAKTLQTVASALSLPSLCWFSALLLASFLLSSACFFANALLLHALSLRVGLSPIVSYTAAVAFLFSPASIFMTASYSEGAFTTLALSAMLAREHDRPWLAALLFGASTLFRANGWIFAGFFVFDAIRLTTRGGGGILDIKQIKNWLQALLCVGIVVAPYALLQVYFARRFCASTVRPPSPDAYCNSIWPNVYGHVQSKYWNVGFFRYWTWKQVPNFLFALPVWTLSVGGITTYARADPRRFASVGHCCETASVPTTTTTTTTTTTRASSRTSAGSDASYVASRFDSPRLLVYIYLWLGLFLICVTVLHGPTDVAAPTRL